MFPRIQKSKKNGKTYEYLVISQSVHVKGKGSTTKNISNLGNINHFNSDDVHSLIDGFIRIFKLEQYALSDNIEIIDSLDHGDIIFWQKIWNTIDLSSVIKDHISYKHKKGLSEVEKYIEMMVINRCIDPLSKLGMTRWIDRTCYKVMKDMSQLSFDVNYFYRSMDYLLEIKDEVERSIFEKLKHLFSINVKMTFYDITSTYFYNEKCPISANGYSRDNLPERKQIIVGVVTSYEGYPIKHYVFEGNTKDETTVQEVIHQLKEEFQIEETTFVGDRGMITKLNIESLISEGYDYIMGVRAGQSEIAEMIIWQQKDKWKESEDFRNLKCYETIFKVKDFVLWKINRIIKDNGLNVQEIQENNLNKMNIELTENKDSMKYKDYKKKLQEISQVSDAKLLRKLYDVIKKYNGQYQDTLRYVVCLNRERKLMLKEKREEKIKKISLELDKIFTEKNETKDHVQIERLINKIFEGYKGQYRKVFRIKRDENTVKPLGYEIDRTALDTMAELDGVFMLQTSKFDIDKFKIIESYKNLQEVEILFDDFKNFVDVRPIRHWLEKRVRSHVFICLLALLLKRIFEINYLKGRAITEATEELSKSKLLKYRVNFSAKEDRTKTFLKVTNTTPLQKKYFSLIGINNPENLEKFIW